MYSPEVQARLAQLRAKLADGSITEEEMIEGVRLLRGDRKAAAQSSETAKRRKAVAAIPSADDLLAELGGLDG